MGVPAITPRSKPVETTKLKEGYRTLFAFANKPTLQVWEDTVTLPGWDMGEPVPQTSQHNDEWETMAPHSLKKSDPVEIKAGYSIDALADIQALGGIEQAITIHLPTGKAVAFFGYLKSFKPDPFERGKKPMATMVLILTNVDPSDGTEAGWNIQSSDSTPGS